MSIRAEIIGVGTIDVGVMVEMPNIDDAECVLGKEVTFVIIILTEPVRNTYRRIKARNLGG